MPYVKSPLNGNIVEVKDGSLLLKTWGDVPSPDVPKPPASSVSSQPSAGVSTPPPVPTPSVPTPPQYTSDQLAHQAWINKAESGQGGMDAYTAKQNQRWQEANQKGDADLISRLQADSQRVGYTLPQIPKPAQIPVPPTAPTVQSSAPSVSTPNMAYNVGTNADREAEARRRQELALAEKRRISEQQKKGLLDSFGKIRTTIGEDRALQNSQMQNRLDPFNGRSNYERAMLNFSRDRTDREMQQDLSTKLSNVDQLLADYENASETERQRIVDELTRQDRSFGLEQGQLTGNYNGSRTLAGSAQDANYTGYYGGQRTMQAQNQAFQQQMAMADLMGQFNGQSTLAGKQANLNAALQVGDRMGKVLQPTNDWGGPLYNQQGVPNFQSRQEDVKNGQWQQEYDRQVGNDKWQRQYQQAQMDNWSADNARQNAGINSKAGNKRAVVSQAISPFVRADQYGNISVTQPYQLRQTIIALGLTDDETDSLLKKYGVYDDRIYSGGR